MIPPSCPIILMESRLFPDNRANYLLWPQKYNLLFLFCPHKSTTCYSREFVCEAFTPTASCLLMMRPPSPLKEKPTGAEARGRFFTSGGIRLPPSDFDTLGNCLPRPSWRTPCSREGDAPEDPAPHPSLLALPMTVILSSNIEKKYRAVGGLSPLLQALFIKSIKTINI